MEFRVDDDVSFGKRLDEWLAFVENDTRAVSRGILYDESLTIPGDGSSSELELESSSRESQVIARNELTVEINDGIPSIPAGTSPAFRRILCTKRRDSICDAFFETPSHCTSDAYAPDAAAKAAHGIAGDDVVLSASNVDIAPLAIYAQFIIVTRTCGVQGHTGPIGKT